MVDKACPVVSLSHTSSLSDRLEIGWGLCKKHKISEHLWFKARSSLRPEKTVAALALTAQKHALGLVRNPGGYMRELVDRGEKDKLFLAKSFAGMIARQEIHEKQVLSFFPDTPIAFTAWSDLLKEHCREPKPDPEFVAQRFRYWCQKQGISPTTKGIDKFFIGFCKKFSLNWYKEQKDREAKVEAEEKTALPHPTNKYPEPRKDFGIQENTISFTLPVTSFVSKKETPVNSSPPPLNEDTERFFTVLREIFVSEEELHQWQFLSRGLFVFVDDNDVYFSARTQFLSKHIRKKLASGCISELVKRIESKGFKLRFERIAVAGCPGTKWVKMLEMGGKTIDQHANIFSATKTKETEKCAQHVRFSQKPF